MTPRAVAALLVAVEGAAACAAGVGFAAAAAVGDPADPATTVVLGVLLAVLGAGVLLAARGVRERRPWARTPAFLTQFFALVVAWYQRHTLIGVTIGVGVVALAAATALAAAERDDAEQG